MSTKTYAVELNRSSINDNNTVFIEGTHHEFVAESYQSAGMRLSLKIYNNDDLVGVFSAKDILGMWFPTERQLKKHVQDLPSDLLLTE